MSEAMWAPSIKRDLGDVWHIAKDGHARCNPRLRLSMVESEPRPGGYRCKRCEQLKSQEPAP
jgi:hypothetical protein